MPMPVGGNPDGRRPSHSRIITLTHEHVAEALLSSPDEGKTIDLSHLSLSDLDEAAIEELANVDSYASQGPVMRIALGFNYLRGLSNNFTLFNRLRYLNLKSNSISVFPLVLTNLPTLEILDVGRNKISVLPEDPGTLVNLRVFSLTRNRLEQIPVYLKDFDHLKVLKVDHNPISWPDETIMGRVPLLDTNDALETWLNDLKEWLTIHAPTSNFMEAQSIESVSLSNVDDEGREPRSEIDLTSDEDVHRVDRFDIGQSNWAFPPAHDRTHSEESFESLHPDSPAETHHPPPISDSPEVMTVSQWTPPSHGIPSPPDLEPEETTLLPDYQHGRNASYSPGIGPHRPARSALAGKKSLPDLRLGHHERKPQLKSTHPTHLNGTQPEDRSPSTLDTIDQTNLSEPSSRPTTSQSSVAAGFEAAPLMEAERNSYFRRISVVESSSAQASIPPHLLQVTDAIRGLLFALSQIYSAVRNYIVYATDDRLFAILGRVLDPANQYMSLLINALDTFDAASQKGTPSPSVCRHLIESSKDNVAVFGKVVGMLQLQLKLLAVSHDVRYTRTLLLMLYGAMAEVYSSWTTIIPHIENLQRYLRDGRSSELAKASSARMPISPIKELNEVPPLQVTKPGVNASTPSQSPRHRVRRHAGSFSHKDLQLGRNLSFTQSSHSTTELPINRPTQRQPQLESTASGTTTAAVSAPGSSTTIHSREPSLASSNPLGIPVQRSRSNQSPSPSTQMHGLSPSTHRAQLQERPMDSSKVVDQDLILAIEAATDSAQSVWLLINDVLDDVPDGQGELKEQVEKAVVLTKRLRENSAVAASGSSPPDKRTIADDAHAFVKLVVQISILLKDFSAGHFLSSPLRSSLAQLTKKTQEVTIFLHVSSFSQASTPRPFSPAGSTIDDGRPLGRSRSATAASATKLSSGSRDAPWSAMPHQTFKVPPVPK